MIQSLPSGSRQYVSNHLTTDSSISNRPDQPNDSCLFTPPSKTRSTSSAISHPAARCASSETKRSGRGEPPPPPEPELRLPIFPRPNSVRVTAPFRLLGRDPQMHDRLGARFRGQRQLKERSHRVDQRFGVEFGRTHPVITSISQGPAISRPIVVRSAAAPSGFSPASIVIFQTSGCGSITAARCLS